LFVGQGGCRCGEKSEAPDSCLWCRVTEEDGAIL